MRLINARQLIRQRSISFTNFHDDNIPEYAILSHTWNQLEEVTFEDCKSSGFQSKSGYAKIFNTCELAVMAGIEYAWVDTCCIDKSSSAELTEAINSMFKWYQRAKVCFAYLADIYVVESLNSSRWFQRGWTLQELIAPTTLWFYNSSWGYIGSKDSLVGKLSEITLIDSDILNHKASLDSACVAKRLSWVADRKTTRAEDMSYCLLGILGIYMPMQYGEGHRAFRRLQEEIVKSTYDLSLLAWIPPSTKSGEFCGFLAESVHDFRLCSRMYPVTDYLLDDGEMTITNKGIRLRAPEYIMIHEDGTYQYALKLNCLVPGCGQDFLTVPMRKIGPNIFIRARNLKVRNSTALFDLEPVEFSENEFCTFTLLSELPTTIPTPQPLLQNELPNIVLSSRLTAVEIDLTSTPITRPKTSPWKSWDVEDCAFIGTRSALHNWGVTSLENDVLLVCFWHKKRGDWEFEATLVTPDSNDDFDYLWRSILLYAQEFDYQAPAIRRLVEDSQVPVAKGLTRISCIQVGSTRTSFTVERKEGRRICMGPRWKIEVTQREV